MKRLTSFFLASISIILLSPSFGEDFPKAPPNLKEVKAKGYPQLSAEELKTLLVGDVIGKNTKGDKVKFSFNADGTVDTGGNQGKKGKWRIDESKNTYCKAFQKRANYEENCFAVFRDPDGVHYHDYDVHDGLATWTWRRLS